MTRLVLDTSVAVRWYLPDERDPRADGLRDRLVAGEDQAFAPAHFPYEVFSSLFRAVRNDGRGTDAWLRAAVRSVRSIPVTLVDATVLFEASAEIGIQLGFKTQGPDLPFFALARHMGVPLWTGDGRFARRLGLDDPLLVYLPSTRGAGG